LASPIGFQSGMEDKWSSSQPAKSWSALIALFAAPRRAARVPAGSFVGERHETRPVQIIAAARRLDCEFGVQLDWVREIGARELQHRRNLRESFCRGVRANAVRRVRFFRMLKMLFATSLTYTCGSDSSGCMTRAKKSAFSSCARNRYQSIRSSFVHRGRLHCSDLREMSATRRRRARIVSM